MRKSRSSYGFRWAVSSALAMGLMLLASQASAQATLVQAATPVGAGAATSVTGAFTTTPTTGNVLVAIITGSKHDTTGFTLPSGWHSDVIESGSSTSYPTVQVAHRIAPNSPASSYTFTAPSSQDLGLQLYEFSGLDTATNTVATIVDVAGSTFGQDNNPDSGSVTTTNANDFMIAGLVAKRNHAAPNFSSPTNGFTEFSGADFTGGATAFAGLYRAVTATGAYDTSETTGNTPFWAGAIVAFKVYCPPPGTLVVPLPSDMKANGIYSGAGLGWSDATNTNYNFRLAGLPGVLVNSENDAGDVNGDPQTVPYTWPPQVQYYSAIQGDTVFVNADFYKPLGHGSFHSADAANEFVTVGLANQQFINTSSATYNSDMMSTAIAGASAGNSYVKFVQRNAPNGVSVFFHDNSADGDAPDTSANLVTGATSIDSVQIQYQVGLAPDGSRLANITDGGRMRFALNGSGTWSQWFAVTHDLTGGQGGVTLQLQAFSNDNAGAVTAYFGDVVAVVINASSNPVCQGSDLTLSTPLSGAGYTYDWFGPAPTAFQGGDNTSQTVTALASGGAGGNITPGDYSLAVTLASGACARTVTASVPITDQASPPPAPPTINVTSLNICDGDAIHAHVTSPNAGYTYIWTGPSAFMSTGASLNVTSANYPHPVGNTEVLVYEVTATDNATGCTSAPTTLTVIDYKNPPAVTFLSPTPAPNTDFCIGSSISLKATAIPGGMTGQWSVANGSGTFSNPTHAVTTFTPSAVDGGGVIHLTFTISNGSCTSSNTLPLDITNPPTPAAILLAAQPDGTFHLVQSAPPVSGLASCTSPSTLSVTLPGTATSGNLLVVIASINDPGNAGAPQLVVSAPAGFSTAVSNLDGTHATPGQAIFYKVSDGTEAGATVDFGTECTQAGLQMFEYNGVGALDVANDGTGSTQPLSTSVTTTAAADLLIGGAIVRHPTTNITSSPNFTAGASFTDENDFYYSDGSYSTAYVGADGFVLGAGAHPFSATDNATSPGAWRASAAAFQLDLPQQTICQGSTTGDLSSNSPAVGTGLWSVVSGGTGTFSDPSSSHATFTQTDAGYGPILLAWTISNGVCAPSTAYELINIEKPLATPVIAPSSPVICSSSTLNNLHATVKDVTNGHPLAGTTWVWSVTSGPSGATFSVQNGVFNGATNSTGNTVFTPNGAGVYTVEITVTPPNCPPVTQTIDIVVEAPPAPTASASASTFCSGGSVGVNGSPATAGTPPVAGTWVIFSQPGGGDGSFGDPSAASTTFTATVPGTYVIEWTLTNSCGTVPSNQLTIVVTAAPPVPTVTIAPDNSGNECSGDDVTLTASSTCTNGCQYRWTTNAPAGLPAGFGSFSASNNVLSIPDASATNNGNYTAIVRDSVDHTCTSQTQVTLTINPPPAIQQFPDDSVMDVGGTFNSSTGWSDSTTNYNYRLGVQPGTSQYAANQVGKDNNNTSAYPPPTQALDPNLNQVNYFSLAAGDEVTITGSFRDGLTATGINGSGGFTNVPTDVTNVIRSAASGTEFLSVGLVTQNQVGKAGIATNSFTHTIFNNPSANTTDGNSVVTFSKAGNAPPLVNEVRAALYDNDATNEGAINYYDDSANSGTGIHNFAIQYEIGVAANGLPLDCVPAMAAHLGGRMRYVIDGSSWSAWVAFTHDFTQNTTMQVQMYETDATIANQDLIHARLGEVELMIVNVTGGVTDSSVCDGDTITLAARNTFPSNASTYNWTGSATITNGTTQTATATANTPGSSAGADQDYVLSYGNTCNATAYATAHVWPNPDASILTTSETTPPSHVCGGSAGQQLENFYTPYSPPSCGVTYSWSATGSGVSSTGATTGQTLTWDATDPATDQTASFTVTVGDGLTHCSATTNPALDITVTARPLAGVAITEGTNSICENDSLHLSGQTPNSTVRSALANSSSTSVTCSWSGSGAAYLDNTSSCTPVFTGPDQTGGGSTTYDLYLTVTDALGCQSDAFDEQITVNDDETPPSVTPPSDITIVQSTTASSCVPPAVYVDGGSTSNSDTAYRSDTSGNDFRNPNNDLLASFLDLGDVGTIAFPPNSGVFPLSNGESAAKDDGCLSSISRLVPVLDQPGCDPASGSGCTVISNSTFFDGVDGSGHPAGVNKVWFRWEDNAMPNNVGYASANVMVLLFGDLNLDHTVSTADLVTMAEYITNATPFDAMTSYPLLHQLWDLNGDNNATPTTADLVSLAEYLVGNSCLRAQ